MSSNFQERIKNLSAKQKALLAKQIGAQNGINKNERADDNKNLIAFFVADKPLDKADLRESLKEKLPDYMIPSNFVQLDEFPKLPNGKLDANSLKFEEETPFSESSFDAPKTETEKQLAKIWEEVLSFKPIGLNDNFFEIGGDSILSIQIVAKARKVGIVLAPNQLFEHQTISELACFAKAKTEDKKEETVTGDVPLLPIQQWFFEEHKNAPHHWNQAIIFDVPENLDTNILQKSIEHLIRHHDALRLNFVKDNENWNASISDGKNVEAFAKIDLSSFSADEIEKAIEEKSFEFQSKFSLSDSTLFQAMFFVCGERMSDKLLLFAHHLVVDDISWRILFEDLETIYQQLSEGKTVSLSSKTASYKKWGEHLIKISKSDELKREFEFWKSQTVNFDAFPTDFEKKLPILVESIKIIDSELDLEATENLLKKSRDTYNTKTEEILVTALMLALDRWAGIKNFCLGLEKHGREEKESDLDLSNTVGWFTTYFPVSLKLEDASDLKSSIISTKEKLRSVPNKGLGYGVLRYLKQENSLSQKPLVMFNYLGNQKPLESKILGKGEFTHQGTHSPKTERYNLLGINAFVKNGKLYTIFNYSETLYKSNTIENLVEHFESELLKLIEHCSIGEQSEYTPSDFPEADLNQDDLDSLLSQIG